MRGRVPELPGRVRTRASARIHGEQKRGVALPASGGGQPMPQKVRAWVRKARLVRGGRDAARTLDEIEAMPWYQSMWLEPELIQDIRQRSKISPVGESVQEGFLTERMQQVFTRRSAFSYEDIPSDSFGARFAVEHFDPNARETFGEQLAAYLNNVLGAVEPNQAPNYNELPEEDDGNVGLQNFTTTPVFTEAKP